ncbi:phage tail tape measure protein [Streptomyces sp. NPDC000927]|uniref:phage tail tape measure protein n=1 Tax=Streptomyces sp. NPDC000927 TaxID=3154371 RepID=UPI00331A4CEB
MAAFGTAEVEVVADTRNFMSSIRHGTRGMPDIEVGLKTDTRALIRDINQRLRNLSVEIGIKADARALVREIEQELSRIRPVQIPVTADTRYAEGAIRGLRARPIQVNVTADTGEIDAALREIRQRAAQGVTVPINAGDGAGGANAGGDIGDGIMGGISARLAAAGPWGAIAAVVLAEAAMIAKVFMTGFESAMEQQQLSGMLQAQLGLTQKEAGVAGKSAGHLYTSGVVDSMEEGRDAIQAAMRFKLDGKGLGLEEISTQLADVSRLMGEDIGQTARAVGQMVKTGLVGNAQQGLDLLTKGLQGGANAAEDLLDTFTEYSTQFRQLGLSGQEAMGLIQQGLKGGARDADVVADTLKEFSIEAAQGGTRVVDAFKAMHLDAGKFTAAFAKGGGDARDALGQIFDALRGIEDPLERNQAAVGLFGTKAEDLAGALQSMDLSTAAKEMDGFGGATKRAGDALRDNLGTKLSNIGRTAKQALAGIFTGDFSGFKDLFGQVKDVLPDLKDLGLQVIKNLVQGIKDYGPAILEEIFKLGKKIGESVGTWGPAIFKGNALFALLPGMISAAIISGLAGAFTGLWNAVQPYLQAAWDSISGFFTESIPQWVSGLGTSISDGIGSALSSAGAFFTQTLPEAFSGAIDWLAQLPGLIGDALISLPGVLWDAFTSAVGMALEAIGVGIGLIIYAFTELPQKIHDGISALGQFLWDSLTSALATAQSAVVSGIAATVGFFRQLPGQAMGALSSLGSSLSGFFSGLWATVTAKVSAGVAATVSFFRKLPGQVIGVLQSLPSQAAGVFSSIWNRVSGAISSLKTRIIGAFRGLPAAIVAQIGDIGGAIKRKISAGIRSVVPGFANGGIITHEMIARVGEGGRPEVIIPLTNPNRAVQLAHQAGLVDMLAKRGAFQQQPRQTNHTWNVTTNQTSAHGVATHMYRRMILATGV